MPTTAAALSASTIMHGGRKAKAINVIATIAAVLLLIACGCDRTEGTRHTAALAIGQPEIGRERIRYHGCASCHTIAGIPGADALVGPSLERLGNRAYVGGVLINTPQNLATWIHNPPAVNPDTAMQNPRVFEEDARNIASLHSALR